MCNRSHLLNSEQNNLGMRQGLKLLLIRFRSSSPKSQNDFVLISREPRHEAGSRGCETIPVSGAFAPAIADGPQTDDRAVADRTGSEIESSRRHMRGG